MWAWREHLKESSLTTKKTPGRSNSKQGTICTTAFNVLNTCLVIFISTKSGQRCVSLSCLPRTHVQLIPLSIRGRHGNCLSLLWAEGQGTAELLGGVRLLTAGGRPARHMDLMWIWWTGSVGVSLPTHSRMALAGHKSVCSVLRVWVGFSQNEYL